eukprot:12992337-Alexandrium_andersonii.AAC.1
MDDNYRPPTRHEVLTQAAECYQTATRSNPMPRHRFCNGHLGGARGPARRNPDAIEVFFVAQDGDDQRGGEIN